MAILQSSLSVAPELNVCINTLYSSEFLYENEFFTIFLFLLNPFGMLFICGQNILSLKQIFSSILLHTLTMALEPLGARIRITFF